MNCYEGLEVPEHVKYKFMTKFPSKVLVWVAISDRGFSKPYIHESKNAINADIYIKQCIKLLNEFTVLMNIMTEISYFGRI
jgi:Na+/H+ antiporter NhaC